MHQLDDTWARAYYSTPYMGTDGRWNGANSPIDPWQHGNEGGVERGFLPADIFSPEGPTRDMSWGPRMTPAPVCGPSEYVYP